ncbi:unnamed protein product [Moneuplotes crassus]|uniref:Cyclic nucleotide-binding domain-containing protein n=1 Tax=Euplotes crassus TaxID=5936 RepID=A0AAD1Y514_EUPCR|nr:unnamed protein product [Moneuplotes crassus]
MNTIARKPMSQWRNPKILFPFVKNIKFFKEQNLDQSDLKTICERLEVVQMSAGKDVFKYGYHGDKFYIILEGEVSVLIPNKKKNTPSNSKISGASIHTKVLMKRHRALSKAEDLNSSKASERWYKRDRTESNADSHTSNQNISIKKSNNRNHTREGFNCDTIVEKDKDSNREMKYNQVAVLKSGDSFGELALISLKPRAATIRCLTACKFAVLSKKYFIIKEDKISEKVEYLRQIPFFKDATKTKLSKFSYFFEEKKFKRGQIIYKEGEESKFVYIVKEGEFDFYKRMPPDCNIKIDYTEYLSQYPQNEYKEKGNGILGENASLTQCHISLLGKGKIFGEDDALIYEQYTKSCICKSTEGVLFYAYAGEFISQLKNFSDYCYEKMVEDAYSKNIKIDTKIQKKAMLTDQKNLHSTLELCLKMRYKRRKKKIIKNNYSQDIEQESADILDMCPKPTLQKKRNRKVMMKEPSRATRNFKQTIVSTGASKENKSLCEVSNFSDSKYVSFYNSKKLEPKKVIRRVTAVNPNLVTLSLKANPDISVTSQSRLSGSQTTSNFKKKRPSTANKTSKFRMVEGITNSIATPQKKKSLLRQDEELKSNENPKHSKSYCTDSTNPIQRSLLFRAQQSNFSSLYLTQDHLKKRALNRVVHHSQNEIKQDMLQNNYINVPKLLKKTPFDRILKTRSKRSRIMPIASTIQPRSGRLGCTLNSKY